MVGGGAGMGVDSTKSDVSVDTDVYFFVGVSSSVLVGVDDQM